MLIANTVLVSCIRLIHSSVRNTSMGLEHVLNTCALFISKRFESFESFGIISSTLNHFEHFESFWSTPEHSIRANSCRRNPHKSTPCIVCLIKIFWNLQAFSGKLQEPFSRIVSNIQAKLPSEFSKRIFRAYLLNEPSKHETSKQNPKAKPQSETSKRNFQTNLSIETISVPGKRHSCAQV